MSPLWPLTSLTSRRTIFSFTKKPLWQLPHNSEPPISQQELVDEEVCPSYSLATFYPARPGEVLAKKFQLLVKIGWGSQLTVWLRDISRHKWQSEQTVGLKIINSNNADDARHEREIESHITQQNTGHRGRVILRTCLDGFEVSGPEGKHMCLMYEPMREPLWMLQRHFVDRKLPLPIAKAYIYFILAGLDYLYSQCKADGKSGQTIYRCHNDVGALDGREIKNMIPEIADFAQASRLDEPSTLNGIVGEHLGIYPIQLDYYHAPEVILGCGWDFKADIWNFGVLLHDTHGRYDVKSHLAEMIALLGSPPRVLFAKSKTTSEHNWPHPVTIILEDTTSSLKEKDREPFLSFAGQMITWLPEERKTAHKLMDHLFIKLGG
ncbi:kinase-like domain-containing protein [Aspergillus bertholletiae]|uniref:non-specific serine/threonine protein kinase n=1 Tax=Aspergillus bertholletiae TaxID=1226010 RepID=A0A5N7BHB4_9EURO|nr:kinase-like domain-containing protein [Aspergillus bertholletiae]